MNSTAALLRFGLLHGYVTVPEVIAWADRLIAAEDRPHSALLEVATSGMRGAADVADELLPLSAGCDERQIIDGILALMYPALERDRGMARRIASTLYSLAIAGAYPEDGDPGGWMMYFDDALDLARGGTISSPEGEVVAEMLDFLRPYSRAADDR